MVMVRSVSSSIISPAKPNSVTVYREVHVIVEGLCDCFLADLFTAGVAMEENLRAPYSVWTNQMGYISLIPQLPGIYGNVNRTCPRATPSDSGRFTPINPRQMGYNYYLFNGC